MVKKADPPCHLSGKRFGSSVVIQSAGGDDACCPCGESSVELKTSSTSDGSGKTFL